MTSPLAYVGTPGSGKSYDAVANQILPMLKAGRRVVTNIPLRVERIRESIATGEIVEFPTQRVIAEPDTIFEYCTPGSVCVLDEAWKLFPTQSQNKIPDAFKSLLAEHRHMVDDQRNSMVIVLVVQDLSMLANFARGLIQQTYHHHKLSSLGFSRAFRCTIYDGAVTGQKPPESKKVRTLNGVYSKDVFRLYKSHTMAVGEGEGAAESGGDKRALLWKRPVFIIMPVLAILFLVFGVPRIAKQFSKDAQPQKTAANVVSAGSAARPVAGPASIPGRAEALVRRMWSFGGYMLFDGEPARDTVTLTSGNAYVVLPLRRFCKIYLEGWVECEYEGQTISNEVRYVPSGPLSLPQPMNPGGTNMYGAGPATSPGLS